MTKLEDVRPAECYAHARRLLADVGAIRTEMGRSEDSRPPLDLSEAQPRECYFAATATLAKASRLAAELGAEPTTFVPTLPKLRETRPGHVLQLIQAVQRQVDAIKKQLRIEETNEVPAIEAARQPTDVLVTLIQVGRQLSRSLERPFTPGDVFARLAQVSLYAGGTPAPAAFERRRTPRHCYERLMACYGAAAKKNAKHGETSVVMRVVPAEVVPGDVYDLATLLLGEVALMYSYTDGPPIYVAVEPNAESHRLPGHVDQLARAVEAQLG
jgi:hypothetical protein